MKHLYQSFNGGHAFGLVVRQYEIEQNLIEAFLSSMEMDLTHTHYQQAGYEQYIYGSAEAVGLMCLKVFCEGKQNLYEQLQEPARYLGSAFQKVNFLRDIQSDYIDRGRVYFPGIDFGQFTWEIKRQIEEDIRQDFKKAYAGILQLPKGARKGVHLAYSYYLNLFNKIVDASPAHLINDRVRLPNHQKLLMLTFHHFRYSFGL